jgi:hypothetical protein
LYFETPLSTFDWLIDIFYLLPTFGDPSKTIEVEGLLIYLIGDDAFKTDFSGVLGGRTVTLFRT